LRIMSGSLKTLGMLAPSAQDMSAWSVCAWGSCLVLWEIYRCLLYLQITCLLDLRCLWVGAWGSCLVPLKGCMSSCKLLHWSTSIRGNVQVSLSLSTFFVRSPCSWSLDLYRRLQIYHMPWIIIWKLLQNCTLSYISSLA
jgi:hypothetical protein